MDRSTSDNPTAIAPSITFPSSSTTIDVKIIDVCTISGVPAKNLFVPPVPGFEIAPPSPSLVFLLEHPSGKKLLFDLGIRTDWENLSPAIVERVKSHGYGIEVQKGLAELLDEAGVGRENIDTVIWR